MPIMPIMPMSSPGFSAILPICLIAPIIPMPSLSLRQPALEDPGYRRRFFFGTRSAHRPALLPGAVTRRVTQHQHKRLVVQFFHYISHTPACGVCHLPHKPEEAMGAFISAP